MERARRRQTDGWETGTDYALTELAGAHMKVETWSSVTEVSGAEKLA